MRILVVQLWTTDLAPIERSLRAAGIDAQLRLADFQAALDAALMQERFDVVIYDASTPGLSRQSVEAAVRAHGQGARIVVLETIENIGRRVARVLGAERN